MNRDGRVTPALPAWRKWFLIFFTGKPATCPLTQVLSWYKRMQIHWKCPIYIVFFPHEYIIISTTLWPPPYPLHHPSHVFLMPHQPGSNCGNLAAVCSITLHGNRAFLSFCGTFKKR